MFDFKKISSETSMPYVIAEAGINHNGDIEIAKQMISEASNCGAHAIKFQTIFPDELFSKSINPELFEMSHDWILSKSDHIQLQKFAKQQKIDFFSTPFGMKSLKLLAHLKTPIIKIASGELTNHELIKNAALTKTPLLISTGMSTLSEICTVVEILKQKKSLFALMHCNSSYPTPTTDANLASIPYFKNFFNIPVGYSDHTLGIEACSTAVSLGACILEKHFTLDKQMEGPDQKLSADPKELSKLINNVKKIKTLLGKPRVYPTKSEKNFRINMRKSIGALVDIPAGTKLTRSLLGVFRPGIGIEPFEIEKILKMTTIRNIKKGTLLRYDDF